MVPVLLHCCICPKRPFFSDASHLLTHVSSKGHLSHLHKLQVRSHQDPGARQQLATYNEWFTVHKVANLLSERMQQKEDTQARKRATNKRRSTTIKQEHDPKETSDLSFSFQKAANESDDGLDDGVYRYNAFQHTSYPVTNARPNVTTHYPSPVQRQVLLPMVDPIWDLENYNIIDEPLHAIQSSMDISPEMARLKGMIWPGMDLFDSADLETQRKRNQKKDISVLKKMEALSEMVEPIETVSSPGGTMKKRRHMDDMEDDSPVEGESPLMKKTSRRKRKLHTNVFNDVPYSRRIKSESEQTTRSTQVRQKRAVITSQRQKAAKFTSITGKFRERVPTNPLMRMPSAMKSSQSPILSTDSNSSFNSMKSPSSERDASYLRPPKLAFPPTEWFPDAEQATHTYASVGEYDSNHLTSIDYTEDAVDDKKDLNFFSWNDEAEIDVSNPIGILQNDFDDFENGFGPLADVYAFTRNPLVRYPNQSGVSSTLYGPRAGGDRATPLRTAAYR